MGQLTNLIRDQNETLRRFADDAAAYHHEVRKEVIKVCQGAPDFPARAFSLGACMCNLHPGCR